MKKLFHLFGVALIITVSFSCNTDNNQAQSASTEQLFFTIKNPTSIDWVDYILEVPTAFLVEKMKNVNWEKINFSMEKDLPFQLIYENKNTTPEKVLLLVDLKANQEQKVKVNFLKENNSNKFLKRTQAEISHKINGKWEDRKYIGGEFKNVKVLQIPPEHTDHSHFIRYEGPGWESDKVGYRFYLDWRNAVDIFGKKTSEMVLQNVGQDGFDSYHKPEDWGMDVLKVGKSLGIGSIGFWENSKAIRIEKTNSLHCEIVQNGNLQSKIRTQYLGWEVNNQQLDLTSDLTIQAGSRLTRQDIAVSKSLPNLCTGIVKHENGELIKQLPSGNSAWGYLATFGKQTLIDDNLGMVIFFKKENFIALSEDKNSHVVVLAPSENRLTYYYAAAWEQEKDGIKTMESFKNYLDRQIDMLNNNLMISF